MNKLNIKQIKLTYDLIESNFKLDKDLIKKYHIEEGNCYKTASKRTYNDLLKADKSFKLYGVFFKEDLLGFFGTEFNNYVNTIFVKPIYRNKEYMKNFFSLIKETVGDKFYTALYNKNTRAIDFYKKNGGVVFGKKDNYTILEVTCQ